jgi:hypothetical protein
MPSRPANPPRRPLATTAKRLLLAAVLALAALANPAAAGAADAPAAPLDWPLTGQAGVTALQWNGPAMTADAAALAAAGAVPGDLRLPVGGDGSFRRLVLNCPQDGTLVLSMDCPRALKAWVGGQLVLDEALNWRDPQRRVCVALLLPVTAGTLALTIQVQARSHHPESIDRDCPSRHRAQVMAMIAAALPDVLSLRLDLAPGALPRCALRFSPAQYRRDGLAFQELTVSAPGGGGATLAPDLATALGAAHALCAYPTATSSSPAALSPGLRLFVPVCRGDLSPLRGEGLLETRAEPASQIAALLPLQVGGATSAVTLAMPVFEAHGRLAPSREFRTIAWPTDDALLAKVPEPVLPEQYAGFMRLYRRSWQMTLELVRSPAEESGLPNAYVGTARKTFLNEMFMWDSCFTAMAYAYGWRAFPHTATLDDLYSFQQDGGYIPRESAAFDARPLLYEPDFSPNPPMPAVAELCFARLTGDRRRLAAVYPVLVGFHRWLQANRRLADGTYWTDGLANGLDNSPSLGEGYPDLTAQMAHASECLAVIADALGKPAEAVSWRAEQQAIGAACNARLWSAELQFYSTSLAGGGHNPNKVVTGFWPLWAGIVPPERIEQLARHLLDPASFWRPHPVPSLAADSPSFKPGGNYWLGSVWAPTNTVVVKGFQRVGRLDLARQVTVKHLQAMLQVFDANGAIWENYSSETIERGSWSGPDYSWSISGPIRLLIETLLGIEPDALRQTVRWTPMPGETMGIKRLALGPATIDLLQQREQGKDIITVTTDQPFTLELVDAQGQVTIHPIGHGQTRLSP